MAERLSCRLCRLFFVRPPINIGRAERLTAQARAFVHVPCFVDFDLCVGRAPAWVTQEPLDVCILVCIAELSCSTTIGGLGIICGNYSWQFAGDQDAKIEILLGVPSEDLLGLRQRLTWRSRSGDMVILHHVHLHITRTLLRSMKYSIFQKVDQTRILRPFETL